MTYEHNGSVYLLVPARGCDDCAFHVHEPVRFVGRGLTTCVCPIDAPDCSNIGNVDAPSMQFRLVKEEK